MTLELTAGPHEDAVTRSSLARLSDEQQRWLALAFGANDESPALTAVP